MQQKILMNQIPPLPENTILLVEVGSTAHGTGIEGNEDQDEMGVVVETPHQVFGLAESGYKTIMQRTQPEGTRSGPGDTDRTLHSLRRFLRLCADGNPSVLMCLWAPVIHMTGLGQELRDNSDAFIGRHVIPRYRGYMQGQAMRLLGLKGHTGHGKRGSGGREELIAAHGYDTKYAMHCARLGFQGIELVTTGALALPMVGHDANWLRAVRYGEVPFQAWWERVLELDHQLELLLGDESIRPEPDKEFIENWSVTAHRVHWKGLDRVKVHSDLQGR